ncbi:hypothetical protein PTSG_01416 [Salpingoeca rosetta]|uniref:Uncharacterized protein n=1 Tax=Salpingoeca rosetta (strain ATCC 50818 / BSB-021) TaxID=946362 RepID=F2U0A3_SALR5|nr:uncharacterized protein PTSG_01416 [Salpingoeca rosetta]EGD80831.1 hypothetical protein PTSG_01416 [Salpingoeca rosetta]|eukprot:XP_004997392.1 hypothetical protein PTSG_01416 [Salpingoeca rosetta]
MGTESALADAIGQKDVDLCKALLAHHRTEKAFRALTAKLAPLVTALLQGWQQHFDAAVAATPPDFASHVMALRFYTRKLVFGSRACPGCLEDSIPAITETIVTVLGRFPPNRELNRQEDDVKALVNVVLLPCSFLSRTLSHSKAFLLRLMAQSGVDGRSDGNASAALVCLCTAFHRAVKTEQSWLLDDEALVSTVITTILSCAGNCYAAMQRLIYKAGQEPTLTPLYSLVSNALVSAVLGCSVRHFAAIERAMFGHLTDARFFTRLLVHDMWLSLCPAFSLHVMENHIQLLVHMADEQRQRELEDQALSKPGKGKKGAHFALVPFTNRLIYRYVSSIGGDALALCSRFEASSVRSSAWRLVSFAPFAASCKADAILASALPSPVPPADDVVALADCALVIANFVPWLAASGLIEAHIMALDQAAKAHPANLSLQVAVAQLLSAMVSSPTFQNSPFVTSLFEHVIQASATLAGSGMLMAACHSLLVAFGHITLDDNAVAQLTTFVGNLASAATPESLVEFSLFVHLRAFAKATPNPQVLPTILGGESSPAFAKFTAILKQQPLVSTTRLLPADTETALSWIASKQQRLHRRSACRQGGSHETPKAILDSLQLALQSDPPAWFVAELRTMALRLPPNPR